MACKTFWNDMFSKLWINIFFPDHYSFNLFINHNWNGWFTDSNILGSTDAETRVINVLCAVVCCSFWNFDVLSCFFAQIRFIIEIFFTIRQVLFRSGIHNWIYIVDCASRLFSIQLQLVIPFIKCHWIDINFLKVVCSSGSQI